jgi:D-alanine-D-alanine ligase
VVPPDHVETFCRSFGRLVNEYDIGFVFDMFHGGPGYDGSLQKCFAVHGVPHSSGTPAALDIACSKLQTKRLARSSGINTPDFCTVTREEWDTSSDVLQQCQRFEGGVVVKPDRSGSSIGISMGRVINADHIVEALRYDDVVVIEEFVDGIEYSCGAFRSAQGVIVLEPVCRGSTSGRVYSFEEKYVKQRSTEERSEALSRDVESAIRLVVATAFDMLNGLNYLRADLVVSRRDGLIYLLEVNASPFLDDHASFVTGLRKSGWTLAQMLTAMKQTIERQRQTIS